MTLHLEEFYPADDLRPFVQSYWTGAFNLAGTPDFSQSVVPNGYVELIIHITDQHCTLTDAYREWSSSPDYTIIGVHTQPYEVRFPFTVKVFGIRFHPEGIVNVFGTPPATFSQQWADTVDIFGKSFVSFCNRLRELNDTSRRIARTEKYLRSLLAKNFRPYDYTADAARTIRQTCGMLTVDALMNEVAISPRQLQREFKQRYGLTPKEYIRVSRLNAVQKYMQTNTSSPDFGDATHLHGFSDQSHFIREFKFFTGSTPGSFLKRRNKFIVNP